MDALPSSPATCDAGCLAHAAQAARLSVSRAVPPRVPPGPGPCTLASPWGSAGLRHTGVMGCGVSPLPASCAFPSGLPLDDSQMVIALLLFPVTFVTLGRRSAESEIEAGVRDGGEGRDPGE